MWSEDLKRRDHLGVKQKLDDVGYHNTKADIEETECGLNSSGSGEDLL
jgi:hypothetical protein